MVFFWTYPPFRPHVLTTCVLSTVSFVGLVIALVLYTSWDSDKKHALGLYSDGVDQWNSKFRSEFESLRNPIAYGDKKANLTLQKTTDPPTIPQYTYQGAIFTSTEPLWIESWNESVISLPFTIECNKSVIHQTVRTPMYKIKEQGVSRDACVKKGGTWRVGDICDIYHVATQICVKVTVENGVLKADDSYPVPGYGCGLWFIHGVSLWHNVNYTVIPEPKDGNISIPLSVTLRSSHDPHLLAMYLTHHSLDFEYIDFGKRNTSIVLFAVVATGIICVIIILVMCWRLKKQIVKYSDVNGGAHHTTNVNNNISYTDYANKTPIKGSHYPQY